MHDRKVGSLVVTNVQNYPIGIVTDRDLAVRVVAAGKSPDDTPVEEVMSLLPKVIRQDTPIEDALSAMRAGPYRRLPVVDDASRLVGLLRQLRAGLRRHPDHSGQPLPQQGPR